MSDESQGPAATLGSASGSAHQGPPSSISSPADDDYPVAVVHAPGAGGSGGAVRRLPRAGVTFDTDVELETPEHSGRRGARPHAGRLVASVMSDAAVVSPDELAEGADDGDDENTASSTSPAVHRGSDSSIHSDSCSSSSPLCRSGSMDDDHGEAAGEHRGRHRGGVEHTTAVAGVGSMASDRVGVMAATASSSPPSAAVSTVGLINEGCTCYLNSLLQLMFHLSYLRSAVFRIPADERGDTSVNSVYKALQELFFQMQERSSAARTKKLTDAFGWSEQDLFVQHDIQEMATILRDNLEEKMKGTVAGGSMGQLFEGRGEQFVETLDKTFTSRSADVFYDIHIPLADHTNLLDSLTSLTQREKLVGDNKYKVEVEGAKPEYKEAEKGYAFVRFPPVAWFHLKRFAMDLTSPTLEMKKVNTRMEFPLVLDLRHLERGLTPEERAKKKETAGGGSAAVSPFAEDSPAVYDLQGVIVHRGTVRSGHYYCYIRDWDPLSHTFTRWIEFDDDSVRVVSEEVAVNANYGGPLGRSGYYSREAPLSNANAYILSYVRRADAPVVLAPCPTDIITQRVKDAMRREMAEEERQGRLERAQRECLVLYVVTDESLAQYCERCQAELFPRDSRTAKNFAACVVEVPRWASVALVYEAIAAEPVMALRGVTATNCRLWRWSNARAYRPSRPLATFEECNRASYTMSDYLTSSESDIPLAMCVYVQECMSILHSMDPSQPLPLPSAADLRPLVRFECDRERGTCGLLFRGPTRLTGVVLRLDVSSVPACKVQYVMTTDQKELLPMRTYRGTVVDGIVRVPLDQDVPCACLRLQCSSSTGTLPIEDVHVEVGGGDAPPPVLPSPSATKPATSWLSSPGHDRVLLFLKWFDHVSCTVRYVGPALVDRSGTLASLEPMWFLLMGLPVPPHLYPRYGGSSAERQTPRRPSTFAFFEEGRGAIVRELSPFIDLTCCGLQDGAVVVAQALDIPTVYRHAHVETYYRTLLEIVDLRVLEVVQRHVEDGDVAFRDAVEEHRRLAAKRAEAKQQQQVKALVASEGSGPLSSSSPPVVSVDSPATGGRASDGPQVIADPTLDPFNTTLPLLNQRRLEVVGSSVARMPSGWLCESVCDAIALSRGGDPNYIRLYKNRSAAEPVPEERPIRGGSEAVEDLVTIDDSTVSPVIFFERTTEPRAALEQCFDLNVTLRDAAGYALHAEAYTLPPRDTLQGLVRAVRRSVQPWELQLDPWGSLRATLDAPHYLLLAIERRRRLIRHIVEIPMVGLEVLAEGTTSTVSPAMAQLETRIDAALIDYDLVLMPAAPLRPGEQRIACCHGDYRVSDTAIFGHPFVITVDEETTVADAQRLMTSVTHVPVEALSAQRNAGKDFSVMMLTHVPLHFANWSECIVRFWLHTYNASGFIPSLMLNHPRPKEKPGSRYVAQSRPQLKIAKN